jgi:hypothetical protein
VFNSNEENESFLSNCTLSYSVKYNKIRINASPAAIAVRKRVCQFFVDILAEAASFLLKTKRAAKFLPPLQTLLPANR